MIIDFHTHTFPDKIAATAIRKMEEGNIANNIFEIPVTAKLNGTATALEESGKKNGVDLSVVLPVATAPRQTESINLYAARANENTKETGILSFGAIHPDNEDYREVLRGLKARGIKGIKIHPDYQNTFFDDMRYMRIMDYAADLDLIIVTHAGFDVGKPDPVHCTPDRICRVDDSLGYSKLVLAHMGGWTLWDEVEEKILGRNLYLDTAFSFEKNLPHLNEERFKAFIKEHGTERILFATDSPWADQGEYVAAIKSFHLPSDRENDILGGNACHLLNIKTEIYSN